MNNAKQDAARCAKTNAIRAAARARLGVEPMHLCPTCVRTAGDAHCRKDARGKVIEGCIDAFHSGHHSDPERARWFMRPEAQALRAATLASLAA